ncbi:Transposase C of IS166 homeodomain protein [compost metagenome]
MLSQLQAKVAHLQEENSLLRQRLFGRKSEQTPDATTPQLALFSEAESLDEPLADDAGDAVEEAVAPTSKRRGKRKPLPAELPRVEVTHELPEHELTCACGCHKHASGEGEEVSEQLEIVPMQIRHIRKVYACKGCESAPVTADKPAQLLE